MGGGIRRQLQVENGIDLDGLLIGERTAQAVRHGGGQDIGASLHEFRAAALIVQTALDTSSEGNGLTVYGQGPLHLVLAQVGGGHFYLHRLVWVGELRELERQAHSVPHADRLAGAERAAQAVRHTGGHGAATGRGESDLAAAVGQLVLNHSAVLGGHFPGHVQVSPGETDGGGLVNVGCLRHIQRQDDHRVNFQRQGCGVLLSQPVRNGGGQHIGPGPVKGQLAAVIVQRNRNTLAVTGQGPLDSRGCAMLHGQADCCRFIFMELISVSSQGEGQVRDYLNRHRLGRKFPALGIHSNSGEGIVPSAIKGKSAAIVPQGDSGLFAVMGQRPVDGIRLAALHRQANLRSFILMHLVRAGGHSGDDHRQDGDGLAGGILLPSSVHEGGRQGVLARFSQGEGAAVPGEAFRHGDAVPVTGQCPDHGASQVVLGQQLHILGPVGVAVLRQGKGNVPDGQDFHGFLAEAGAAAVLHGAFQRVAASLHEEAGAAVLGEALRHGDRFSVMGQLPGDGSRAGKGSFHRKGIPHIPIRRKVKGDSAVISRNTISILPCFGLILPTLAILLRRTAYSPEKCFPKITAGSKTTGMGNFRDRQITLSQEMASLLQSVTYDIICRRRMQAVPKYPVTFTFADIC